MFENIDIKKVKEELRNYSKNYRENFAKIEKFIETEIHEILVMKILKIIPAFLLKTD